MSKPRGLKEDFFMFNILTISRKIRRSLGLQISAGMCRMNFLKIFHMYIQYCTFHPVPFFNKLPKMENNIMILQTSKIRGLSSLMKLPCKNIQNFWITNISGFFVFHFMLQYFSPHKFPEVCRYRLGH